jgi:hypothetical protein
MANEEQLTRLLEQGVDEWNWWRDENRDVIVDLGTLDLSRTNLNLVNLNRANLIGADLSGATLIGASLIGADLSGANLNGAILNKAVLSGASLKGVELIGADLNHASLSGADLTAVDFSGADLSNASLVLANCSEARLNKTKLGGAVIGSTIFGNVDLSEVDGLETVKHWGPSTIGMDTICRSKGEIPEVFLRGAGVPDTFITFVRSLVGTAIEYNSCFISYSSQDKALARRLYADLQSNGVRCWFAPEDLKIGERFRVRIDESIRLYDKLLLLLSEASVASEWVEQEVNGQWKRKGRRRKRSCFRCE